MTDPRVTLRVENPDEPPRVDVRFEWFEHPLWVSGRYEMGRIDGHEIGLSPELVRDLRDWAEIGDSAFKDEYPPDSEMPQGWSEMGRSLAERVRAELPADWIVTRAGRRPGKTIVLRAPKSTKKVVSSAPRKLETTILVGLLDGEISLTAIDDLAASVELDPARRKGIVLDTLRRLLAKGLVEPGSYDSGADEASAWSSWTGSVDERVHRLADDYQPEVEDWESWGFRCWIAITAEGERTARTRRWRA